MVMFIHGNNSRRRINLVIVYLAEDIVMFIHGNSRRRVNLVVVDLAES